MKIGLVLPGFSADEHDWCIPALLDFVRPLAAEHRVHVYALEYPFRRAVYSVHGATVHSLGGRNRGKAYAPRLWLDAISAICREHHRAPFDILHAFWVNEPSAIALFAGRILRVPVVSSVAGGELVGISSIGYGGQLDWFERGMVSAVMRAADQVTVGSLYLKRLAFRWRPDVHLLPLGVDADRFARGRTAGPKNSKTILNVGSLVPVKQQMELLGAFAQLGRHAGRLEIIGGGPLRPKLQTRADAFGIGERVVFLGELPHDALAAHYREADLVVQSSLHEAQGMAVLEAAACGIPIVGTPVGILPELAGAGGAVAASGFKANDLAEAMGRALEMHQTLGENARGAVERCFTLQEIYKRWMELYRQISDD